MFKQKNLLAKKAFSIVEVAVGLAVVGVVGGGGLTAYKSTNPSLKSDLKKMEKIESALQQYFISNGKLPYPANYQAKAFVENKSNLKKISKQTVDTSNFTTAQQQAVEDGTLQLPVNYVLFGTVPTRVLGLTDDQAYDSQGKNIEYIVHSILTESTGSTNNGYTKINYTSSNGGYAVVYENTSSSVKQVKMIPQMTLKNISSNANLSTNVAFILLSKQKQEKCYVNTNKTNNTNNYSSGALKENCVINNTEETTDSPVFYQGYSKSFDEIVKYKTFSDLIYKAANTNESKNEIMQGDIIQYQPRIDENLQTQSKEVVGAINEVDAKVKFVSTFKDVVGVREQLYYLYTDNDEFTNDKDETKSYSRGLYIFEENTDDSSLSDFKLVSGSGGGIPVGTIVPFAGTQTNPPAGFLWCDGKSYNKTIYSSLYKALGGESNPYNYSYSKDSSGKMVKSAKQRTNNEFFVPDLANRFIEYKTTNYWDGVEKQNCNEVEDKTDCPVGLVIQAGIPDIYGSIGPFDDMTRSLYGYTGAFEFYTTKQYDASSSSSGGGWITQFRASSGECDGNYDNYKFKGDDQYKVFGRSDTVQPEVVVMRYMIRAAENKEEEETITEALELTDAIKKEIVAQLTGELVCNKIHPKGSIYITTKIISPSQDLGCGTWERISENRYLMAVSAGGTAYDAYGAKYTDAVGKYFDECLPNITGNIGLHWHSRSFWDGMTGAFGTCGGIAMSTNSATWDDSGSNCGFIDTSRLSYRVLSNLTGGSQSRKIYKSDCNVVRPLSYGVYIWHRTE